MWLEPIVGIGLLSKTEHPYGTYKGVCSARKFQKWRKTGQNGESYPAATLVDPRSTIPAVIELPIHPLSSEKHHYGMRKGVSCTGIAHEPTAPSKAAAPREVLVAIPYVLP